MVSLSSFCAFPMQWTTDEPAKMFNPGDPFPIGFFAVRRTADDEQGTIETEDGWAEQCPGHQPQGARGGLLDPSY
jgi:hypothetical protein